MNELVNKLLPMPELANEAGKDIDGLIYVIHGFMAVLFIGWLIYYVTALVKFRRVESPKASYTGVKNKKISTLLETGVVIAEVVILVFIALPGWYLMASGDRLTEDQRKEAIEVHVNAQQFAWGFRYAGEDGVFGTQKTSLVTVNNPWGYDPEDPRGQDDFINTGELIIPVDTPIIAHCRSMDVIHSFSLKSMRVCQDCIPGISIPTYFVPNKIGRYTITCAQLCGGSHYAMRGVVNVVSKEEFADWKKSKAPASANVLSEFE
ncbi:MAG: cytochrome c oxidase subunit II [Verrucomicrobia bacterium]|nr:cytochrome c oxidase subunit II [Verrucomicrobiota bacterium]